MRLTRVGFVCSCMDLLAPNLVFLHRILQSTQDTFATTILQCFLQHVLQGCAEPSTEADPESTSSPAMTIVGVFDTRTRDKTCAVRIAALQVLAPLLLAVCNAVSQNFFPEYRQQHITRTVIVIPGISEDGADVGQGVGVNAAQ